jgi:hypothetical protein
MQLGPFPLACRKQALLALAVALLGSPVSAQDPLTQWGWARPPEPIAQAVLAPRHENVTLANASPDQRYFLRQESDGLPTMADFAREHRWFGGLQIDPRANRARTFTTRGSARLSVTEWETGRTIDIQIVGTHPMNSTRLFHALNGLGKTASLYMYPYEDHGPATVETTLDLWARWVAWLDRYVKNGGRDESRVTLEE